MTGNRRRVVGIRFPQWSSVGTATMGGLVEFMRAHELWRLVTENDSYGEMEAVRIGRDWHGDGLLLFRAAEAELEAFRKRGTAVVLTSTEGPDLGYPRVLPDNHEIGRLAARHFNECNLPHIAFLARGETIYREEEFAPGHRVYARHRLRGFRAELAGYSMEPVVHYLRGRPLWEPGTWREVQSEVMAFLDALPKPCGVFAADDSLGAVVLRAADMLGIPVPGQLAVIGYGDDQGYCYASYPAMSSIPHPGHEIGRRAASLLCDQMIGKPIDPGPHIVPVGSVIGRESTDVLAIPDPRIRDLVRWIRLAAPHDPLRVAELADRSGLSLTTLKSRFAELLGHSPKQEINRARLAHLKRLLEDPALPLAEIAQHMKFASAHELSRFFTGATGQRPSGFRKFEGASRLPVAVIFDMDGTLFDSESLYCEAFREAYREQGGELDHARYFRDLAGTTNESIERALAATAPAGFCPQRFSRRWRELLEALLSDRGLEPFPGVQPLLETLSRSGIRLALASSSPRGEIDRCLALSGLSDFFRDRTGGDEVPHGKPAPDIFQLAAARIGVDPANCLAIEDSSAGVTAALAAGMRVVHVTSGSARPVPGAHHHVHSLVGTGPFEIEAWFNAIVP